MSNRLKNVDNLCTNPENHHAHLCELSKTRERGRIEKLQLHPSFVCNNCGNKSNQEGALCAPGPLHN